MTRLDRAQASIGGLGWAFAFFVGMIILAAIIENLVLEQAFDPLIAYANNQSFSSTESTEGLRVLEQWRNLFTAMALFLAGMFFIGYAMLTTRGRY